MNHAGMFMSLCNSRASRQSDIIRAREVSLTLNANQVRIPEMKRKLLGLLRRAGFLILVVWTVVSLVTILIELVPGDPAAAVLGDQATAEQLAQFRTRHGLDRPPFFFGFPQDSNGRHRFAGMAMIIAIPITGSGFSTATSAVRSAPSDP